MIADLTMTRIGEGVELHHHQGRRQAARGLFAQIWDDIGGEQGDPLHVCVLAHSMADVQDDVHQELMWDLRALAAVGQVTDERVAQAGVLLSVVGLYPSLHLNLSDCYRKPGDPGRAREHLQQARAGIGARGDDEYGRLIKGGLDRLAEQLDETVGLRAWASRQPTPIASLLAAHKIELSGDDLSRSSAPSMPSPCNEDDTSGTYGARYGSRPPGHRCCSISPTRIGGRRRCRRTYRETVLENAT
ncbi:hypothetical protein [Actinomadura sp. CNU-125]|uniref:hypothetical protein n=1 Tax=Actinomadura sp. CNU-125 TaxID=1904961 RepID=UPI000B1ECAB0|nr:hypothetical protein [Actinomadura sp. CNU-125]